MKFLKRARFVDDSTGLSDPCVYVQERSLSNQNELIESGKKLENQLDSAREEVSNAFTSIQQQAWSFKEQFNEVNITI